MSPFVQNVTNFISFLTLIADILAAALFLLLVTPLKRRGWGRALADFFGERAIFLSFLVAFAATFGSLFYSQIAGFPPCVLCWWQRIFLYPQTLLLFTAFIKKDENMRLHAMVLSGVGALIALYHTFIQFGGASLVPCSATGPSCTVLYFLEYGYITIPTMSLTAFVLLLLFMSAPNPKKKDIAEL
jgi:disulfide bond formation protein DsbB